DTGVANSDLSPPGPVAGQVQAQPTTVAPTTNVANPEAEADSASTAAAQSMVKAQEDKDNKQDSDQFKITAQDIKQSIEQDPEIKEYQNNIVVQDSPEGLKIEMIDD